MELTNDQMIENAVRDGIREGIKAKLSSGYNSPLDKVIESVVASKAELFRSLLVESMEKAIGDPLFRDHIKGSVHAALAKTLVQRFGGELEKQVNVLKSDPSTRARITLAIEKIVEGK